MTGGQNVKNERKATGNTNILIVDDDDESICKSLSLILGRKGYDTDIAGTGSKALEMARKRSFNVIILDLKLPDMEGVDLLAPLRQLQPETALIMATAFASTETAVKALNEGATSYVIKPMNMDEVLAKVKDVIEKQRLVNEKRQAEKALQKSEERYRLLVETMDEGLATVDENGMTTYVNDRFAKMVGYSTDELINKPATLVLDEENQKIARELWEAREKVDIASHEIVLTRKDGRKVHTIVSPKPISDNDKKYKGILGVFTDITEHKQMQEELLKGRKLESLGVMAGGLAHDFNNIMTVIMGNVSLAKAQMDPDHKIFPRLEEVEKASKKARELTSSFVTFSKGGEPIKKTQSVVDSIEASTTLALSGSYITSDRSFPDDLWPVEIDEIQIGHVIQNLVVNAREAMPDGGKMRICAENMLLDAVNKLFLKEGKYVKISIQDQGIGIPGEQLANIFDPYFSTKEIGTQKGMGMGLATVYAIIKNHDGHITVDSEVGVGTTVHIYLPASQGDP